MTIRSVFDTVSEMSLSVKALVALVAFVGTVSAFYATAQSLSQVPMKLSEHDKTTQVELHVLERMLCIQIADHRQQDWRLCYTNPSEVLPSDINVNH